MIENIKIHRKEIHFCDTPRNIHTSSLSDNIDKPNQVISFTPSFAPNSSQKKKKLFSALHVSVCHGSAYNVQVVSLNLPFSCFW